MNVYPSRTTSIWILSFYTCCHSFQYDFTMARSLLRAWYFCGVISMFFFSAQKLHIKWGTWIMCIRSYCGIDYLLSCPWLRCGRLCDKYAFEWLPYKICLHHLKRGKGNCRWQITRKCVSASRWWSTTIFTHINRTLTSFKRQLHMVADHPYFQAKLNVSFLALFFFFHQLFLV